MANLTLRKIWIVLAIPCALAAALLLNRVVPSDKTRVEWVVESMVGEAGQADVDALFTHIAADYQDDVHGRKELQALAERVFSTYRLLRLRIQRMAVSTSGRLASVEVSLSARGSDENRNETEGTSAWNVQLRKDPDKVWRVTRITPLRLWETDIPSWRQLPRQAWQF